MDSKSICCPYCGVGIVVMRALNGRKVVVDAASVEELLCRIRDGRLMFDRNAGHVLHSTRCRWRFDPSFVEDEARCRDFREYTKTQVKHAVVPQVAAYRELQLEMTATPQMVKAAYRKLAREYHPDLNPHGLNRMQEINSAFDVLRRQGLA